MSDKLQFVAALVGTQVTDKLKSLLQNSVLVRAAVRYAANIEFAEPVCRFILTVSEISSAKGSFLGVLLPPRLAGS